MSKHWILGASDGITADILDVNDPVPAEERESGYGLVCSDATPEDAETIVRAVNSFEDLLEACKYLLDLCDRWRNALPARNENESKEWTRSMEIAREAIAKATGDVTSAPLAKK